MPRKFGTGAKKKVYESSWLKVYELEIDRDGEPGLYSVAERPADSVVILAKAADGRVLLEKQFRFPTGEIAWELPMGSSEVGESPDLTAARELREETGVEASVKLLGRFHPIPGLMAQWSHVYTSEISGAAAGRVADFDEESDEILERRMVAPAEVQAMIARGDITDGMTLAALALASALGQGL